MSVFLVFLFFVDDADQFVIGSKYLSKEIKVGLTEGFILLLSQPLLIHQFELLLEFVYACLFREDLGLLQWVPLSRNLNDQLVGSRFILGQLCQVLQLGTQRWFIELLHL